MARMDRKQAKQKLTDLLMEFHGCKVKDAKIEAYALFWNERGKTVWPIIAEMGWTFKVGNDVSGGASYMRCDLDAAPVIVAAESYVAALTLGELDDEEVVLRNILAGNW